jgi:hypothetical protein
MDKERIREDFERWFYVLARERESPESRHKSMERLIGMILLLASLNIISKEEDEFLTSAIFEVFI